MKKVYLLLSSVVLSCFAAGVSAQVTVSNPTLTYTNLTTAFAAINAGTHTGAITIDISASINEGAGIASLNGSGVGPASYSSILIRPTAPNIVDSGMDFAVIQLKGADNVTIDGDYAADVTTTRDLTFRNTSLGGNNTVVWMTSFGAANGAANNMIRNCIIEGVNKNETSYGFLSGGHSLLGIPADAAAANNIITDNFFHKTRDGIAIVGGATFDGDWTVRNNIIGSMTLGDELGYQGVSAVNVQGIDITNNQIAGINSDLTQSIKGINLGQGMSNANITGNRIFNILNNENTTGYGAAGIYINLINGSSNTRIVNNEIWSIGSYGNTGPWTADNNRYGIVIAAGGGFTIYYNTVLIDLDPEGPDGKGAAMYIGVGASLTGDIDLKNNILYNEATVGTNYSIYNEATTPFTSIDHNMYYNAGPDLSYNGAAVPDLATWKALTFKDTGSVSGRMVFGYGGDNIYVDNTIDSSWFVNGRGVAILNYGTDRLGNSRSTMLGTPTDIGSREFTPALGVLPPNAIASAPPAVSTTTSYTSAGRKVAEINWGPTGTVPTDVAVKYYSGVPPNSGGIEINSYWNITETGGSGYDYTLALTYTEAEQNGAADGILGVIRDSTQTGIWANSGGSFSAANPDGKVVQPSNTLTAFTNFSLGNIPLGLELLEFTARNNGNVNDLSWKTADEKNMSHFEVTRSDDGVHFTGIGKVDSKNEFMGSTYTFRDNTPKAGYNYYRLKMYEQTGIVTYSDIVAVKNGAGVNSIDITSVHPNPATNIITVSLNSAIDNSLTVEVTDITGKTLLAQTNTVTIGGNNIGLNVSELVPGVYIIKATLADGAVSVQKFVKQ